MKFIWPTYGMNNDLELYLNNIEWHSDEYM
jgi:hypothetical protein